MSRVDDLRSAGATRVLEPGEDGYDEAVTGFDTAVVVAPTVVVDAQTASDVAATVAVAAEDGRTVTVLGAGHGRLHDVRDGLALSLIHI